MLVLLVYIVQEFTVNLQTSFNTETILVQNLSERNIFVVELHLINSCLGVEFSDLFGSSIQLLSCSYIDLVQENLVSEANLLDSLVFAIFFSVFLQSLDNLCSITDCDATIDHAKVLDFFIDNEGLNNWGRISHASRLNDNVINLVGVKVLCLHF